MLRIGVGALLVVGLLAGCGDSGRTTDGDNAGGSTMAHEPQSQQQAQDTLVEYLRRTLAELPAETVLDATRFGSTGHNISCDDNPTSPTPPTRFRTIGLLLTPPGTDVSATVAQVGDIWRKWGWEVNERTEFRIPNRFGDAPDGYRLQIEIASDDGYPPTVQGSSPCFAGELAREIPVPTVLTA